ncbi:MAG TPA: DUF3619 family protein [Burkholderiaceae bacterium]|nr:DUF3619 family protein [Burkholderiaceae bacterium]
MNKVTTSAALEARFAARITQALDRQVAAHSAPDVEERLRFARDQALARARAARQSSAAGAPVVVGLRDGTAGLSGPHQEHTPWWLRLSALLPLIVLLAGLLWIDHRYAQAQIEAAAEVDAAILSDSLPPDAYRDPGFVEFLRSSRP